MSSISFASPNSSKNKSGHQAKAVKAIIPWQSTSRIVLVSILLGSLLALAAPGIGCWWIVWLVLIPVWLWLKSLPKAGNAFVAGVGFGTAFHCIYLSWLLSLHPMDWLGFSKPVSLLVALSAWAVASISGGIAFGILSTAYAWYFQKTQAYSWLRFLDWLILPTLWVLWFQAYQVNAFWFPWALLDYTHLQSPLMRALIKYTGSGNTVTWVVVSVTYLFSQWVLNTRSENKIQKNALPIAVMTFLLCGLTWIEVPKSQDSTPLETMNVVSYQGNVDIGAIKTGSDYERLSHQAYLNPLSKMDLSAGTLLALPEEGIVPGWVNEQQPEENISIKALQDIANRKNIFILSGVTSYQSGTKASKQVEPKIFNSTILIRPKQHADFYQKNRLVPFGEVVPYLSQSWVNQELKAFEIPFEFSFTAGKELKPLSLSPRLASTHFQRMNSVGNLICFELIYADLAKQYQKQGAQLLVNSSNLGWFHQNQLMSSQFLAIGQVRALETGLPVVIVSNSGPSAMISPDSILEKRLPASVTGSLSWRIPGRFR